MTLFQPDTGYFYNSDSLFLYNFINHLKPKGNMLDVGAGCGIIGLLCARDNPKVKVQGIEKQDIFLDYIKKNAQENSIDYNLHHGDFIEYKFDDKYDYIVSNPPFYHSKGTKSKNNILEKARYDINLPLKDFFKKVSQVLKPKSHFVFCYDAKHFLEICVELQKVKMKVVDVQFVHPKIDRVASIVLVHARNGSNSLMNVMQPFICFDDEKYSKEAQAVYNKAKTKSVKCQL